MNLTMKRSGLVLLAGLLALGLLTGCGKKGNPKPPSEDSNFPRTYPTQP